jgi:hypothetical protein
LRVVQRSDLSSQPAGQAEARLRDTLQGASGQRGARWRPIRT